MKWYSPNLAVISLGLIFACNPTPKEQGKNSRVSALPYYQEASFTPVWFSPESDSVKHLHKIPSFRLVNQLGDTITERSFENKIYVTDFFFTSCFGICPKMTSNMAKIQEAFLEDEDVLLLSHSVTPKYDSVPVLARYAENNKVVAGKWHLVTGARETIYDLGRTAYFVEEDLSVAKSTDDFLHTENFVLVDKNRNIRGIYNGLNKTAIAQLIADIKTLKKEK
ncbi:MAG: SCO family protein [Bacteroidota bacterium]